MRPCSTRIRIVFRTMTAWPRTGSGGRAARAGSRVLANLFAQFRQRVGLEEILITAGPLRLFRRCHPCRIDDHLDVRGVLARPDSPAELQSVDTRHLDVRDHNGGLELDARPPGFVAVPGFQDLMTIELEEGAKHGPH